MAAGEPYGAEWRDIVVLGVNEGGAGKVISTTVQYHLADELGNLVTGGSAPSRADTLYDTVFDDVVHGGGGNDQLLAQRGGNDILDGDEADDTLAGGAGDDLLIGGSGRDRLDAGTGSDRLYGDIEFAYADVQARQNDHGSDLPGDTLDGGVGAIEVEAAHDLVMAEDAGEWRLAA